jgi:4-hydroxythreonine-4-phosphate dehydrogenase
MLDDPRAFTVCSLSALSARDSRPGVAAKIAGHGTFSYIRVAAKLALSKVADAIATAPLSKNILIDAGYDYPGHTELLGELGGTPECRMMLIGDKLRVVPVTGHIAFAKVPRSLNRDNIQKTFELTYASLKNTFGIARPRIAVAALNPHGGEKGIFGSEEIEIIAPAVKAARKRGIPVHGPFPADSLFHHAARGDYDAVVCMYHDQGLIPLKLHIEQPIGAEAKYIILVFEPHLGGVKVQIKILPLAADHELELRNNDALGDIPVFFKLCFVASKRPRQPANFP